MTAALSALLEPSSVDVSSPPPPAVAEAIPEAIDGSGSEAGIALNEMEIIEASGRCLSGRNSRAPAKTRPRASASPCLPSRRRR